MNWPQFKDPVSHMCLARAVVASWSLFNDKYFMSLNTLNFIKVFVITSRTQHSHLKTQNKLNTVKSGLLW